MILVFGGTTEGKQVAEILDELEVPYYYSTKANIEFTGNGTSIHGILTISGIENFCNKYGITQIINASHPFAIELHKTIADISIDVPLIKFQREFTARIEHSLVYYASSFEDALQYFEKKKYNSLVALSGVQTISKLQSFWKKNQTWFRILDRDSSRMIAAKANFPQENLLFGYPQSQNKEMELFNTLSPDVIFTKESGSNGKLNEKIAAALATNIPIVILEKPEISNRYLCVSTKEALQEKIKPVI